MRGKFCVLVLASVALLNLQAAEAFEPQADRCVILISVDGLANFYLDDPKADMPTLKRAGNQASIASKHTVRHAVLQVAILGQCFTAGDRGHLVAGWFLARTRFECVDPPRLIDRVVGQIADFAIVANQNPAVLLIPLEEVRPSGQVRRVAARGVDCFDH